MWPVPRTDNNTTFIRQLTRNSGSLNLLEHSGSVQACIGIAFKRNNIKILYAEYINSYIYIYMYIYIYKGHSRNFSLTKSEVFNS
jgi:hypothetical protein